MFTLIDLIFIAVLVAGLGVTLGFGLDRDVGGYRDSFRTADKPLHALAAFGLTLTALVASVQATVAVAGVIIAGVLFELVQVLVPWLESRRTARPRWGYLSPLDAAANVVGAVSAVGIWRAIGWLGVCPALLVVTMAGSGQAQKSPWPARTVILDETVARELAAAWPAAPDPKTVVERAWCVTDWGLRFKGADTVVVILTVEEIGDSATAMSVDTHRCPPRQPVLHQHLPVDCERDRRGRAIAATCKARPIRTSDEQDALCTPSLNDVWIFFVNQRRPVIGILCDREGMGVAYGSLVVW